MFALIAARRRLGTSLVLFVVVAGTVAVSLPSAAVSSGAPRINPAPSLPGVAGLQNSDRNTGVDPVSVPASGSTSTGQWVIWSGRTGRSTSTVMTMPVAGGRALLGDWNGDGVATPGRYEAGQWFVTNASVDSPQWEAKTSFGGDPADIPVVANLDKDKKADIGVFRAGTWIWQRANGKPARNDQFGAAGDIPIVGDWDGDGRDDIGVVRGGAWILRLTRIDAKPAWVGKDVQVSMVREARAAVLQFPYGLPTDTPVVGDWDRDGRSDPGVVRNGRDWLLSDGLGKLKGTTRELHILIGDAIALVGNQATAVDHCPTATVAGERYGYAAAEGVRTALTPQGSTSIPGNADILATVQDGLRYAMTDALTSRLRERTSRPYYDPLSSNPSREESVRRSANSTLAAAIMLTTTSWKKVNGITRAQLLDFARWNIRSLACQHGATSPGGWGNDWQSALWAVTTGQAGWLLWDDLSPQERGLVAAMVVSEAEYASARGPRYFRNRLGQELTPGDSQSDEVSWDLTAPALALAMMPNHRSAPKWRNALIAMSIAAFARPDDLHRPQTINGIRIDIRLPGTNANEDGTVTNHGIVNPDYTQNVEHLWWAASMLRAGRHKVPQAVFLNADIVYRALSKVVFQAPPYAPPGGTVYQPQGQIYYPMGVSWGVRRPATFVGVDAFANVYAAADVNAGSFLAAHAADTRAMQRRFSDGHIYADGPSEDSYKLGKEEYALQQMALAWWAGAIKKGTPMRVDDRYYPGISLGLGAALP
ncbi:MAG: hypothetical protein IPO93_05625 [Actinobacteria bacterium]|nr:hypothetical protein [Actinomycetota bacterium]